MKYVWFVCVEHDSVGEYQLFSSKLKAYEKFSEEIDELKKGTIDGRNRLEVIADEKEHGKVVNETINHTAHGWLVDACVEWGKKEVR
ncbi:hypothetical protein [Enterococcus wangshanyuanii]|uniref:Uncharacterized protein n=1 Tax=Enterococcus wangshanyuanii TaxID=2005703 RepID=A0ABQ1PDA7_9ENTE|nr:hypothetical protein [Enterococcus wangshanyuanii]GGC94946.1 hypothetical protein GCM10011573_25750 [Enterococcus wangshanyuanii]